jgi:hypothetical protein
VTKNTKIRKETKMKQIKANVVGMFDEFAEKHGTVVWDGVELAITQSPYPDGTEDDWGFYADAMDKAGNLWWIRWDPIPDVDTCLDYCDQVEDWDSPAYAEMVEEGYYLDE